MSLNKIEAYLNKCARAYYAGDPIISDEVFDRLADSVGYNKVGAKQHEHIEEHFCRLYSLQKFYEDEGKESPLAGFRNIDVSPKLDGAAISILYVDGDLTRVLTRGDGIEGTVVTEKFLNSNFIPHTIPVEGIVQITGELCAPKYIENARNFAAGSLNLNDSSEFKTRPLRFFAYSVQPNQCVMFHQDMRKLETWGFGTIKEPEINQVYPCDGVVFRLDNYSEFYQAGYTTKHPKGAYALKERGQAVETILLGVEWQTGKSGKVTPVAILEPVLVGDATVSRATLNNISFIRALDLRIGDRVGVVRAGEIIPQVTHKVE